jgi:outer membrane protein TolC
LAEQSYKAAVGQLGPQLSLNGSYTRTDGSGTASFGGSGGGSSTVSGLNEFKQFQTTVTNIIDVTGIAKHGVSAARLQRDAARQTFDAQSNQTKKNVRTSFFGVLQAKSLVKVQRDELAAAQQRLKNAKVRYEAGDISEFDVLRLETEAKRSEQALVAANGDYAIAKQRFNDVLGRDAHLDFEPVDAVIDDLRLVSYDEAITRANQARPEIQSTDLLYKSFRHVRLAFQGASLPVFTVGATWTRVVDPFPGQEENSAQAFLQFSAPLYTSGINQARAKAARADEEKAKVTHERTKSQVALEVRTAITQIQTSRESYEVALKGQELAKESLRLAQLRYDEGAGILLDVTTAQSELTRADSAVVTTRYQLLTAIAALQSAVGSDDVFLSSQSETKRP